MKKYFRMSFILAALFLIVTLSLPWANIYAETINNAAAVNQQMPGIIRTIADEKNITKFGNIVLSISRDEIIKRGYEYGDIVKVKIFEKKYRMPLVSNYSDVDAGSMALVADKYENKVLLAINLGDFASQCNIATKSQNTDDGSFSWDFIDESADTVKVSIWLKKQGGYKEQLMLHRLEGSIERNDYPDLSDEEFANFREVNTTGIGDGILYRTSSPIDSSIGRCTYADKALKKNKVNVILNLTDDEASVDKYENFTETYYSETNYKCIGLSLDFYSDDFKSRLAEGLRFLADNPGTYAIHCKEGKDRAGFVVALLECLMGADIDEVKSDYMLTYYNYYGVTKEDERYETILNSNFVKLFKKIFTFKKKDKNKDLASRNLAKCAEKYLKSIGLTKEEIGKLKKNLAGTHNNSGKDYTDIAILSTTDMHGRCWDINLLTGSAEHNNMLRVSTAVKEIRDEFGKNNVILIDNGDLFQGTPVSQTQLFEYSKGQSDLPLAMAVCLKEIQYDAMELGNHEFNYDWNTMSEVYKWLNKCGVEVLAANANYIDNENNTEKNVFTPYIIKDIMVNGNKHKIGILGLENCDISRWDIPTNYPNIQFVHPGNDEYSMSFEANLFIPQMINEGCEFIIVTYHGGLGDTEIQLKFGLNSEAQGKRLIEETDNIDILITGHDHTSGYSNTYVKNKDGDDVLVVNGGGTGITKSVFRFSEKSDGMLQWEIISSENMSIEQYGADLSLEELMKPYVDIAELEVNKKIGVIVGEWDNNSDNFVEQTDTLDLLSKAIIEVCNDELKQKYDEKSKKELKKATGLDHIDIDLVMSTCTTDNYIVKPGNISMKDIYRLYRYANTILVLPIAGRDIKTIMEENASDKISSRILNGKVYYYPINDIYTNLTFGGLNFYYDMARPEGERVTIQGFSNGRKFDEDSVYLVAVNNYILENERCGLRKFSVNDAIWSQIEDKQGETVQDIISEYISGETEKKGGVSSDAFNWEWNIIYSGDTDSQQPYEGKITAEYADELKDGHEYVLFYEAKNSSMTENPVNDGLKSEELKVYGNYLIDEMPDEIIKLTAHIDSNGVFSFTDGKGRYLSAGTGNSLKLIKNPSEKELIKWSLVKKDEGWNVFSSESDNKAIQFYSNRFTIYEYNASSSFLFNFYELK